ncbi:hypothetical protein KJ742_03080 [Patescibacteria group bacterium]|nr:hypothetical protein [Patescibacteria group bacterium]MBU1682905.1 hypothetical protein [Patescibacteria group bacterium]
MPGQSINSVELVAIQTNIDSGGAPDEVLKVLSGAEYVAYRNGDSVAEVIIPLRERIFRNVALPGDFLDRTDSLTGLSVADGIIENSHEIAVLCASIKNTEEIRGWLLKVLANHHNATKDRIEPLVKFSSRSWFDGPVAISIIEDEKGIADQL